MELILLFDGYTEALCRGSYLHGIGGTGALFDDAIERYEAPAGRLRFPCVARIGMPLGALMSPHVLILTTRVGQHQWPATSLQRWFDGCVATNVMSAENGPFGVAEESVYGGDSYLYFEKTNWRVFRMT